MNESSTVFDTATSRNFDQAGYKTDSLDSLIRSLLQYNVVSTVRHEKAFRGRTTSLNINCTTISREKRPFAWLAIVINTLTSRISHRSCATFDKNTHTTSPPHHMTDMDNTLAPFPPEDGRGSPTAVYQQNNPALTTTAETSSTSSSTTTTTKKSADESMTSSRTTKRIRFQEKELLTRTIEVERCDPERKEELFYNKTDFARFQQDEQRRYDRMMMKKIQNMVHEKMADQIADARAQGSTDEEIDAMMPQTTEEIFALLGMAGGAMPQAPRKLALDEPANCHHVEPQPVEVVVEKEPEPQPVEVVVEKEPEPNYSDDDIYAMFGVDDTTSEAMEPVPAAAPVAIQEQQEEISDIVIPIAPSPSKEDEEDCEAMMPIPPAPVSEEQDSEAMVPIIATVPSPEEEEHPGLAAPEEEEDHNEASENNEDFEDSNDAQIKKEPRQRPNRVIRQLQEGRGIVTQLLGFKTRKLQGTPSFELKAEVEQEKTNDQEEAYEVSKEEGEVAPLNDDSDHWKEVPNMQEDSEEPAIPELPAPEPEDNEQSFTVVESRLVEDDEQSFSSVESPLPVEVADTNMMELVEELEEAQVPQTAEEVDRMKIVEELQEAKAQYESIVKKFQVPIAPEEEDAASIVEPEEADDDEPVARPQAAQPEGAGAASE
jgi:hypothetical protein